MITDAVSTDDLARFRSLVERQLGLRFHDDNGTDLLAKALQGRLLATERSCLEYLDELQVGHPDELAALGCRLTIGETYFLRHMEQFRALTEKVVPDRLGLPGRSGPLRVLSAGCASGEESYSLAIMLREVTHPFGSSILGVDVNPEALQRARHAQYTTWSLRSVPDPIQRRWFTVKGYEVRLDPDIRGRVQFRQANLIAEDPDLWRPDSFDVVFCRNVLMYFAPDLMAQVVHRIARALAPGGYLFLGSAETLRGIPADFQLCESHGAFYYRQQAAGETAGAQRPSVRRPAQPPPAQPPPTQQRQALQRQALQRQAQGWPAAPPSSSKPDALQRTSPQAGVVIALDLLREERFGEALTAVEQVIGAGDGSPNTELLLLRAALLTHGGSYPAAVEAAHCLLQANQVRADRAGAHALLATCREFESDVQGAIEHCRTAIRCDPTFAMAHIQLARLTQRTGETEIARREYATSVQLLASETDRNILLFGGGFDREALISLCQTQSAGTGPQGER